MKMETNQDELRYISDAFKKQGDFSIFPSDTVDSMIQEAYRLNSEYMEKAGVDDGSFYDDDEAFNHIFEGMNKKFPDQKMYLMRFVDDYMEYDEAFLESIGAIDWE